MKTSGLFASGGVVGLSGGSDSLLLSHVLEGLKARGHFQELRHLHIDHGLRPNSAEQAQALKAYAQARGWNIEVVKLDHAPPNSNIESWGRLERKRVFDSKLGKGELLYLGHHIDDSFEWYLRQTLGSSASGHTYGIPLINGPIRRPFHCLTKNQIDRFSTLLKLPIQRDQSNDSLIFQRNAISKLIKGPLLKLFPKGLAHYVEHANNWASKEGLRLQGNESSELLIKEHCKGRVHTLTKITAHGEYLNDWAPHKAEIVNLICQLSTKGRGELRQNLAKLFKAATANGARGPLHFSGGVRVFIYPGFLVFLGSQASRDSAELFSAVATQIPGKGLSLNQAYSLLKKKEGSLGLISFEAEKLLGLRGLRRDELFDDVIHTLKEQGLSLRPFSQLYQRAASRDLLDQKFKGIVLL